MKKIILLVWLWLPLLLCGQAIELVKHPTDKAGYSAEYQAVYNSFTTKPDVSVAVIWDTFVSGVVADGVWSKLDVVQVYATHTADAVEWKNWINPGTNDPVENGTGGSFGIHEGYTPNDVNTCIDTKFNGNDDGVNYKLNDASFGLYVRLTEDVNDVDLGATDGTNYAWLYTYLNGAIRAYVNSTLNVHSPVQASNDGIVSAGRGDASNQEVYLNGVQADSEADASSAIPAYDIFVGAYNNSGSRAGSSGKQYSLFYAGANLSAAEHGYIKIRFEAAMDAL